MLSYRKRQFSVYSMFSHYIYIYFLFSVFVFDFSSFVWFGQLFLVLAFTLFPASNAIDGALSGALEFRVLVSRLENSLFHSVCSLLPPVYCLEMCFFFLYISSHSPWFLSSRQWQPRNQLQIEIVNAQHLFMIYITNEVDDCDLVDVLVVVPFARLAIRYCAPDFRYFFWLIPSSLHKYSIQCFRFGFFLFFFFSLHLIRFTFAPCTVYNLCFGLSTVSDSVWDFARLWFKCISTMKTFIFATLFKVANNLMVIWLKMLTNASLV